MEKIQNAAGHVQARVWLWEERSGHEFQNDLPLQLLHEEYRLTTPSLLEMYSIFILYDMDNWLIESLHKSLINWSDLKICSMYCTQQIVWIGTEYWPLDSWLLCCVPCCCHGPVNPISPSMNFWLVPSLTLLIPTDYICIKSGLAYSPDNIQKILSSG